eukprot:GILJ01006088.1.p1 GENE.GILJ01006088.1~~GILJ01006088.1.p1  ORF type:complete len:1081 (+),score=139.19 GILJ01006088.1:174-3245(+)
MDADPVTDCFRCIVHKGDSDQERTPTIGLAAGSRKLVAGFSSGINPKEWIQSQLELPLNEWTHISYSFSFDTTHQTSEFSLYVDGVLDTQAVVRSLPLLNAGPVYFGKTPWDKGIEGSIFAAKYFSKPLALADIQELQMDMPSSSSRYEDEFESASISSLTDESECDPPPKSAMIQQKQNERAAKPTLPISKPANQPDNGTDRERDVPRIQIQHQVSIQVSSPPTTARLRQLPPTQVTADDIAFNRLGKIIKYYAKNIRNKATLFDDLNNGKVATADFIHSVIQSDTELAEEEILWLLQRYPHVVENGLCNYDQFLKYFEEDTAGRFQSSPRITSESAVGSTGDQKPQQSVSPRPPSSQVNSVSDSQQDRSWRNGSFEVAIEHCIDCHQHQTTTKHKEQIYGKHFNNIAEVVMAEFPDAQIVGNVEGKPRIGSFEVYVRGVKGEKGAKLVLFSKLETKRWPTAQDVVVKMTDLIKNFGDAEKFAKSQQIMIGRDRINGRKTKHEYPYTAPTTPSVNTVKQQHTVNPSTERTCKHWGCNQTFTEQDNTEESCRYHPGRWQYGHSQGWWPASWTCCSSDWTEEGCSVGKHEGPPTYKFERLCVNRGEVNSRSGHPDSFCGKKLSMSDAEAVPCRFHKGKYVVRQKGQAYWTCCKEPLKETSGCVSVQHTFAQWPDSEAQLNFAEHPDDQTAARQLGIPTANIPRIVRPQSAPAHGRSGATLKPSKSVAALYSTPTPAQLLLKSRPYAGFFKKTEPYRPYSPSMERAEKDMLAATTQHTPKFCTNWACEKEFVEARNGPRACLHHPGKWDFGHPDGLWAQHWTCCKKDWETPGCTRGKHIGSTNESFADRRWHWPHPSAQRFFKKKPSWYISNRLERYVEENTIKQVSATFDNVVQIKKKLVLDASDIPYLCECLHLYDLAFFDIVYHFKYLDTRDGTCRSFFEEDGVINKSLFVEWWFAPVSVIRPRMATPPKTRCTFSLSLPSSSGNDSQLATPRSSRLMMAALSSPPSSERNRPAGLSVLNGY